ncbi:MAG: flagellar hook-length control protein FliK [Alphaproteobacteria bacterium]|uniref:Flagellar hook-length control protein FliK n=1 Tax=Candidatus Nitrobium versatile TaxID=2884831 RepID=A0A953M3Z4_9BACT|nr:flagellar hook-length control protein FliK [Candidatus Nitrobium versatile]
MINFKITGTDGLTILHPSGKELSLKVGEIVRARVMEILPAGGVSLNIKGNIISARTEVPLEKGSAVLFKVLNTPSSGQDLQLQYMGNPGLSGQGQKGSGALAAGNTMNKLLQDLSASLLKSGAKGAPSTLQVLESIIRELPADLNSLPPETKVQLQSLLQASLTSAGRNIQSRVDTFLRQQFPGGLEEQPAVQSMKREMMVAIGKMLGPSLKEALENTGVVFEAKLKSSLVAAATGSTAPSLNGAVGNSGAPPPDEAGADSPSPQGTEAQKAQSTATGRTVSGQVDEHAAAGKAGGGRVDQGETAVKNDLKAVLLRIKELLEEKGQEILREMGSQDKTGKGQGAPPPDQAVRNLASQIDGLLRDIETFQLLSKTNDSFYTFLPVSWKELKEGEIEFKRGRGNSGGNTSCSCRIQLDLEQFGSLSVMVLLHNKEFYVSFHSDNADFKEQIGSGLEELKESFSRKGLRLTSAKVIDAHPDSPLEQFEKTPPPPGIINIEA